MQPKVPGLTLEPHDVSSLAGQFAELHLQGPSSAPKIHGIRLSRLNRLLEFNPADMTATVETGMTLACFQDLAKQQGQWLPLDPPRPDELTLRELLEWNKTGPRRFGYGLPRDFLLGCRAVLPDGRIIRSGGKVVKNVAGYDLCKLFVGSRGSLGVLVEASFKLIPLPETEVFLQAPCRSLTEAGDLLDQISSSPIAPAVLDLRPASFEPGTSSGFFVVLGFSGPREEVESYCQSARALGAAEPANLDYEAQFWAETADSPPLPLSVRPSEVTRALAELGPAPFVCRAGNGLIFHRGTPPPSRRPAPPHPTLSLKVKNAFDPNRLLPDFQP